MNPASTMGPIISMQQLDRIHSMVSTTSATILAGGQPMTCISSLDGHDLSRGFFYQPTVIESVDMHDPLWREEIFGPIVVLQRFRVTVSIFWRRHISRTSER